MTKMSIEVNLITAAVDIEAKAGDRLMLFNGTIIGVYTGADTQVKAEPRKKAAIKTLPAPAPANAPRAGYKEAVKAVIKKILQDSGTVRTEDLYNAATEDPTLAGVRRDQIGWVVREMRADGEIHGVPINVKSPRQGILYSLPKAA